MITADIALSSFAAEQAEQFSAYFRRCSGGDLDAIFRRWSDSKDFAPRDRRAISREVQRLVGADR